MKITSLLVSAALAISAGTVVAADPPSAATRVSAAPLITQSELLRRLANNDAELVVLDVRTPAEFAAGHVPGARNVSHEELPARLAGLSSLKDKDVVLYCRSGRRTAIAEKTLRTAGFTKLLHLEGDFLAWEAAQQPLER